MFRGIRYVIPNVVCHPSRREVKEGSLEGNSGQTPFVGPGSFAGARGGFAVGGAGGLRVGGPGRLVRLASSQGGPDEGRATVLQAGQRGSFCWSFYDEGG